LQQHSHDKRCDGQRYHRAYKQELPIEPIGNSAEGDTEDQAWSLSQSDCEADHERGVGEFKYQPAEDDHLAQECYPANDR
jgi:hypothetical protein